MQATEAEEAAAAAALAAGGARTTNETLQARLDELAGQGLHWSTSRHKVSTFCSVCWVYWVVSVTKMAEVELEGGRV